MGWIQKPPPGTPLRSGHPQLDGLVGWWLFQQGGGGIVNDLSGNGNIGTLNNFAFPPTAISGWNPGKFGRTLVYDASDDYVDCGSGVNITVPFTIIAWVNPNNFDAVSPVCWTKSEITNYYGGYMNISTDQKIITAYGTGGSGPSGRRNKTSASTISAGVWSHLAGVVRGPTDISIYINGVDGGGIYSGTGGALSNAAGTHQIGKKLFGIDRFMDGLIDDVRIYNRALREPEIEDIMHRPFAAFATLDIGKLGIGTAYSDTLADSISLNDVLEAAASVQINDNVTLAEILEESAHETITESVGLTDNLSGVLASGIDLPGLGDISPGVMTPKLQPKSWEKTVGNNPTPISLYVRSSAGTTYTNLTVTDSAAWDLSFAEVGDVAITEDFFAGVVTSIDDGNDEITVRGWDYAGVDSAPLASRLPADGQHVSLHKFVAGKRVLVMSNADNTNDVYVGTDENITPLNAHRLSNDPGDRNFHVLFKSNFRFKKVQVSSIWAVCGSDMKITVTVDGALPRAQGSSESGMAYSTTLTDTLSLSDTLVAMNPGPAIVQTNDVVVGGDYMFCAVEHAAGGGILAYDISDPTAPTRVGYFSLTATTADAPKRIQKSGNFVFTSDRHGIRTVDVTDPASMSLGQELVILAAPSSISGVPTVAIAGSSLFHQGRNQGLRKYSIADPRALALLDSMAHGNTFFDLHVGGALPYICMAWYAIPYGGHGDDFQTYDVVYTDGTYVYAASDNTVWIFDVTGTFPNQATPLDPGNLVSIHTALVGPLGSSAMIAHAGVGGQVYSYNSTPAPQPTYSYMRSTFTGVAFSASSIAANSNIGALSAPANGYAKFVVDGSEGYVVGRPGCVILTIASGAILNTIAGTYRGHDVVGNYLYLAETDGGGNHHVDIYDISTPASPSLQGTAT